MKPFLKWAGGKYRLLEHIAAALPPGKRLIEPFVGSGAVFLNTGYDHFILADANHDLIHLFGFVKAEGPSFIAFCRDYFTPQGNDPATYYALRHQFNTTQDLRLRSALFLYLNRHGYNGLCRYNRKGGFNVPFGRYKAPYFPEREMLFFHQKVARATLLCGDFRESMRMAEKGDVVYCDPPYVPLSRTANFTAYAPTHFAAAEQTALAEEAEALRQRGVTVIISNHDTEFTRTMYCDADIRDFSVRRFISRDGANRGMARELLAIYN